MSKKQKQRTPKARTHDAGIFRDGMYFEASKWSLSNEPRRRLAGYKRGGIIAVCAVTGLGVLLHPVVAGVVLLLTAAPAAGVLPVLGFRRWQAWPHTRSVVKPIAVNVGPLIDQPPRRWRLWLHIPESYRTTEDGVIATIDVPPDAIPGDRDIEDITRAVTAKTGIESPDLDRKLNSRSPQLIYTRSQPPPSLVKWEDVEKDMRAAGPDEFVIGIGKKDKLVKASLSEDSPHFGISMGSGAGKSNLATFWMLQELRRGSIVLILDAKFFSYPWAFKDMDAEYDLLPNVRYCRRTDDLHDAMAWMGDEFARRTMIAERGIDADGHMHRDVGPRMLIVCEEMNLAEDRLKDYWKAERALDKELPGKSPAFKGLGAVAFGGRAVRMHLVLIGQQLTAAAVGGGAVRENVGVKCLSRYSPNSWKMQVGDVAMPPAPWTPGRVQCVAGGEISETQTPWLLKNPGMNGERIRELALAGTVMECPPGMPGAGNGALAPVLQHAHAASPVAPEQGFVVGPDAGVIGPGRGPGAAVTLAEAVREGLFVSLDAARQAKQRKKWEPVDTPKSGGFTYRLSDIYAYVRGSKSDDSE